MQELRANRPDRASHHLSRLQQRFGAIASAERAEGGRGEGELASAVKKRAAAPKYPRGGLRVSVQVLEELAVCTTFSDVRQQVHKPILTGWLLRLARLNDVCPARFHARRGGHVDRVLHAHHHCDLSLLLPHLNVEGLLYPLQRDATTGLSPMALRMCNRWCSLWLNSVGWLRV